VHAVTGDVVVKLPLRLPGINSYALAGGGGLIFDPTGNFGGFVPGASSQGRGAFLYGVGADYAFTRHLSLRAEYRGFLYKNPDFGLRALNTDSWAHTAQPSAGFVYHFLVAPGPPGNHAFPSSSPAAPAEESENIDH
jgi:opacity protein-like surface antigen